jgi:hypothetical protein
MREKRKKGGRCERKRRKEKRGKKVFFKGGGRGYDFRERYMPVDPCYYLNREAECRDHRLSQTN